VHNTRDSKIQFVFLSSIFVFQEGDIISIDEVAKEIYDQFRNQYFKMTDVG
jgi:hypothetical protein